MVSQVVKRRRTSGSDSGSLLSQESTGHLKSVKPARELAEPYRICTAKFPIDALTPSWSIGSNRPVNNKHVLSLCKTFEGDDGLQRESQNNYLMVGCTGEQVERMKLHHHTANTTISWSEGVLSFLEWMAVNEENAEIISGQHRVEALKMFLQRNSKRLNLSEGDERWWVCDMYNLGILRYFWNYVNILTLFQIYSHSNLKSSFVLIGMTIHSWIAMRR